MLYTHHNHNHNHNHHHIIIIIVIIIIIRPLVYSSRLLEFPVFFFFSWVLIYPKIHNNKSGCFLTSLPLLYISISFLHSTGLCVLDGHASCQNAAIFHRETKTKALSVFPALTLLETLQGHTYVLQAELQCKFIEIHQNSSKSLRSLVVGGHALIFLCSLSSQLCTSPTSFHFMMTHVMSSQTSPSSSNQHLDDFSTSSVTALSRSSLLSHTILQTSSL